MHLTLNAYEMRSNFVTFLREKDKLKEREEAWMKIDELARKNPNVSRTMSWIPVIFIGVSRASDIARSS